MSRIVWLLFIKNNIIKLVEILINFYDDISDDDSLLVYLISNKNL